MWKRPPDVVLCLLAVTVLAATLVIVYGVMSGGLPASAAAAELMALVCLLELLLNKRPPHSGGKDGNQK